MSLPTLLREKHTYLIWSLASIQTSLTMLESFPQSFLIRTLSNYLNIVQRKRHINNFKYNSLLMNLDFREVKWNEMETEILKTNWYQHIGNLSVNEEMKFPYGELIRICYK